jgi:outer membrane receptor protein involved in Fe transport
LRNPIGGSLNGGLDTGVDVSRINAASRKREGIDISASYRFSVGAASTLNLGITATRTLKSVDQNASFLPANDCVGLVGNICLRPLPKWQFIQTSQFNSGPLTVLLRWRYLGKITQDAIALGGDPASDYAVPTIGDRHYFDLSASYNINDNFTFRFGVNNLLNSKPPIVGNDYGGTTENSGNTFPQTYDPLGRRFFIGATAKF